MLPLTRDFLVGVQFLYQHGDNKLELDPLRAGIDPATSDFSIGKVKVEVRFTKLIGGRWGTLTNEGSDSMCLFFLLSWWWSRLLTRPPHSR